MLRGAAATIPVAATRPIPSKGVTVVVLGAAGGPSVQRSSIACTALVVDGAIYVVDAGLGLTQRFHDAGLDFAKLRAMFLTHLHSDHMADFFSFFWMNFREFAGAVEVYGPPRASVNAAPGEPVPGLPPGRPGLPDLPLINPALPTPGITDILAADLNAAAYDINERLRHTGTGNFPPLLHPHDLPVPAAANARNIHPRMSPVRVYEDDRVKVTATLVNHPSVFPAYGFRFDTAYGSVTFSGDTTASANLIELAGRTDLLVHEVIDAKAFLAWQGDTPVSRAIIAPHTPLEGADSVGTVATRAGARALLLNHLIPIERVSRARWLSRTREHYRGPVHVARDLLRVPVRR